MEKQHIADLIVAKEEELAALIALKIKASTGSQVAQAGSAVSYTNITVDHSVSG